jgi:heme-degrading monooxygenase HmoA
MAAVSWTCSEIAPDARYQRGGGEMWARVAWGKVKPGTWDEYERVYRELILPASRNVTGLRFRELLRGADDPNEGISLTLWDSREDMEAYERSATYQDFLERVKEFYVGEYWIKHFDVRLGEELHR